MIICLIDALAVLFCLTVAGIIRYGTWEALSGAENIGNIYSIVLVLHVAIFYFLRIYDDFFRRGRYSELALSVKYNFILIVGAIFLGFGLKSDTFQSRLMMAYFFAMNTMFIWLVHLFVRNRDRIIQWSRKKKTSLLLVTTRDRMDGVLEHLEKSKETTWQISGVVLLDGHLGEEETADEVDIISADEESYLEYATRHVVDEVLIIADSIQRREAFLKNMILEFEKMGVAVNLNIDLFDIGLPGEKSVRKLENYQVVTFSSNLFDYRMILVKRMIDIVGAAVGLAITFFGGIILAPFLLLESPGPLIFCQKRVGMNGRVFDFYKFRSMYMDAEERKKDLMDQNEMQGPMFKIENDPRITKVGKFIRRTSIDELPQFWNVLKGDMSLVGTRPPTLEEYEAYSYYQKRRISFRPGITGLWQISGRNDIKDFDEVVKLDLEYIDNWSLKLDMKIILKTIVVVFCGKGAR